MSKQSAETIVQALNRTSIELGNARAWLMAAVDEAVDAGESDADRNRLRDLEGAVTLLWGTVGSNESAWRQLVRDRSK